MFWMGIWKDDNAIFFKIQHINESAGFFGKGLVGDSLYRFSFTPYWFVYKLFGTGSTLPYYILIFIFYFLATIAVYKVVSKFISKKAGSVASILFACGFIGSEGYFWIANAMVSDVAVILFSLMLLFYYKFFLKRKPIFYILAVIFFWATAYFVPIRSYYFIAQVLLFEIIFFVFKKVPKSIFFSFLRSIPFILIFRYFFLIGADTRAAGLKGLFLSVLKGNLYMTYGMFSSFANIVVSDSLSTRMFDIFGRFAWYLVILLASLVFYLLFRKRRYSILMTLSVFILFVVWNFISKSIFSVPLLNLNLTSFFVTFLGGVILFLLGSIYFVLDNKYKNKYLFLLLSLLISIGAYYAYDPLVSLNTTHRYLTGAFYFLITLLSVLYIGLGRKTKAIIIFWAVFNLLSSFIYQHNILIGRSFPVESFYQELRKELPSIKKGNLLYFDLSGNEARNHFTDAISTASMPDETSFAWRYGMDRYDFNISRDFDIKDVNTFNSFYYNGDNLVNTTDLTKKYLTQGITLNNIPFTFENKKVHFNNPIDIVSPLQLKITLTGTSPNLSKISFPYNPDISLSTNTVAHDSNLRREAFDYQKTVTGIMKNAKVQTSSSWMSDIPQNSIDNNINTNWRANRIAWGHEDTFIGLDLGRKYLINKLVWINGFGNSTPTNYSVEVSNDGVNWKVVTTVKSVTRIDDKNPQVVSFEAQNTRFIRMDLRETLDTDAPQIAEIWPVPTDFDSLDIPSTLTFLNDPVGYVSNKDDYLTTLYNLNYQGQINLKWFDKTLSQNIYYDGKPHEYIFNLPAGGYKLSDISFEEPQINGTLTVDLVSVRYLKLQALFKK